MFDILYYIINEYLIIIGVFLILQVCPNAPLHYA